MPNVLKSLCDTWTICGEYAGQYAGQYAEPKKTENF